MFNFKLNDDGEVWYNRCLLVKRLNYDKLGMKCLYGLLWREFVDEWSCCVDKFSGERCEVLKSVKVIFVVVFKIGDFVD